MGGLAMAQDEKKPAKCSRCGSSKFELRNYEMMWSHRADALRK